jgi:hypothetical protein
MSPKNRDNQIRRIMGMIEKVLNEPIPGTPNISGIRRNAEGNLQGRVMYVALPGSKRKSQNVLSHRAQQVMGLVNRTGRTTAAALMEALEVNRNVIAGAVHELKQAGFLASKAVVGEVGGGRNYEAAAEVKPRARKKNRNRK